MVYIQLERWALLAPCYWSAGTDLVVITFQLPLIRRHNCLFFSFSFSFFYFFFVSFYRIFQTYFSLLSPVSLALPLPPTLLCSRQEGTTIRFVSDHSLDYSVFLAYTSQEVRPVLWSESLCTEVRYSKVKKSAENGHFCLFLSEISIKSSWFIAFNRYFLPSVKSSLFYIRTKITFFYCFQKGRRMLARSKTCSNFSAELLRQK